MKARHQDALQKGRLQSNGRKRVTKGLLQVANCDFRVAAAGKTMKKAPTVVSVRAGRANSSLLGRIGPDLAAIPLPVYSPRLPPSG